MSGDTDFTDCTVTVVSYNDPIGPSCTVLADIELTVTPAGDAGGTEYEAVVATGVLEIHRGLFGNTSAQFSMSPIKVPLGFLWDD